jgi:hypothetical protein
MPSRHSHPPGKSKTDLRRGHFTPGHPVARKDHEPRRNTATTHAEQALLFSEAAAEEPAPYQQTMDD